MKNDDLAIIELTEDNIKSMVYEIRGMRVMLDADLARIYGYKTKRFNEQVKRNVEKFDEDFMFQLTDEEMDKHLRSIFATSKGVSPKSRYLPYAFTEQGIYMLMTVLRGESAVKQSKALIRLFKKMKDYIIENALTLNNVSIINDKFSSYDKRFETIENKLEIVMDNFIDPSTYKHFLIMNGEKFEADIAYQKIYSLAKESIIIIDDYIDIKTFQLLLSTNKNVDITIISDNVSRNPIQDTFIDDFMKESNLTITMKPSNNRCHDRYIVIDYLSKSEKIYMCGSSSKDAGNKITTIMALDNIEIYHPFIDSFIRQQED